jgi:hypothetical protein
MALTRLETDAIEDQAVTTEKIEDQAVDTTKVTPDVLESGIAYSIVFGG